MLKKSIIFLFLLFAAVSAEAQGLFGLSDLSYLPSATLAPDKSLSLSANYLDKNITPAAWDYNTYNYFINLTFLPFLEIGFGATALKNSNGKFYNQDRNLSAKIAILKQKGYRPSVAIGARDILTTYFNNSTNRFFSQYYIAVGRQFKLGKESVELNISGIYGNKDGRKYNAGVGLIYTPSFLPNVRIIGEGDIGNYALSAKYTLWHRLSALVVAQKMTHISAGLSYRFLLK